MRSLQVGIPGHEYPIHIGPGLLGNAALLTPHITGRQVMVITNSVVAPLYLDQVADTLSQYQLHTKILPDGEKHKNLETLESIFDAMLSIPCDRSATVVALGGGVVGDIAGFAAACYQRGVPLIQLPTTLLAQVDSSVGGKTAVNHPKGKNMIGAFYQPRAVIADTATLNTLPERELSAGLAEVIKYGLIRDREFFDWLEANMASLLAREPEALGHAIERSCRNKTEVVVADEREAGVRALLNLGHTFGHAIETATGYSEWLHGEAVAVGILMAARMSQVLGQLSAEDCERTRRMLEAAGLPTVAPPISVQDFLKLMAVDKKVAHGTIRLVLLRQIGDAYLTGDYSQKALHDTLEEFAQSA